MKAKFFLLAVLSAVLFTGCAGLHTLTETPIANSPVVTLDQDNFHVVKHVEASAVTKRIMGIGGLSKRAMRQNAVADMMKAAQLTGSQAVVNVTTKVSTAVWTPFYVKTVVTAYGTVVEFDKPNFDYTVELFK
jgi:uncharacterized protein YbjQ (UPF0145 family)